MNKTKIHKQIPLANFPQNIKYLVTILRKEVTFVYEENYKALLKKLIDRSKRKQDYYCYDLNGLMSSK